MSLSVQNFQLATPARKPCVRSGRITAVPKASEEGVCKRRDALQLGLQMSGLVGAVSVFPTVGAAIAEEEADVTEQPAEIIEVIEVPEVEAPKAQEEVASIAGEAGEGTNDAEKPAEPTEAVEAAEAVEVAEVETPEPQEEVANISAEIAKEIEEDGGEVVKDIPQFTGQGIDDAEELAEIELPKLQEEIASVDVSPEEKAALEAEVETIETEIIQVEEEIARGVSDDKIEDEAVGILQQILAFKARLGF